MQRSIHHWFLRQLHDIKLGIFHFQKRPAFLLCLTSCAFWFFVLQIAVTLGANLEHIRLAPVSANEMTVFFHPQTDDIAAQQLAFELQNHPLILKTALFSKSAALEEVEAAFELGDILEYLPTNPLPSSMVLTPIASITASELTELTQEVVSWPTVAQIKQTNTWSLQLLQLERTAALAIKLMLLICMCGVVLQVTNRIGFNLESHQDEIYLKVQLGASHQHLTRPFLYQGLLCSGGGFMAASVFSLLYCWVTIPLLSSVMDVFDISLPITYVSLSQWLSALLLALVLGSLGAWLAFFRHRALLKVDMSW